jgi:glucose-1-phosphate cytidylyltransferase
MLTYGDGVSDINLDDLHTHHRHHGRLMTMTGVQPDGRFGTFEADEHGTVTRFLEKPRGDGSWINGGFFVCEPGIFEYLDSDDDMTVLEQEPFERLAQNGELCVYHHRGFWKCMGTLRDKIELNRVWNSGTAQWKTW